MITHLVFTLRTHPGLRPGLEEGLEVVLEAKDMKEHTFCFNVHSPIKHGDTF